MKAAILFGFGYIGCSKEMRLPGILIDLHRSYKLAIGMGAKKILVFTDHITNIDNAQILKLVVKGEMDGEVIFFIDRIKNERSYRNYIDYQTLISEIELHLIGVSRLFIYYSGHSERGLMLFPKTSPSGSLIDRLPLNQIIRYGIKKVAPSLEIFSIIDCCESNGMALPFRMVAGNNNYEFLGLYETFYEKTIEVLCLSSGSEDESASARIDGSIFTHLLYKLMTINFSLNTPITELLRAIKRTGYRKNPIATTTHPQNQYLWRWIAEIESTTISYNPIDHLFLVKR